MMWWWWWWWWILIFFLSRQLAEKVERFARKEAELAERGECVPVIYPDPSVPYEERCIMWSTQSPRVTESQSPRVPDPSGPQCALSGEMHYVIYKWFTTFPIGSISGLVCLWSTSSLLVIYLWSTRALEVNYPCMSSLDIIGGHSTPLLCDRHTDFPKWNEIFPVTLKSVKAHASVIFLQLLVIPAASSAATKVITCQAWCNCLRLSDRS